MTALALPAAAACSGEAVPQTATTADTAPQGETTPTPTETPTETPSNSWETTVATVSSGVVQITVTTCEGAAIGTGFLLDEGIVMTAAHVVEDAAGISLRAGQDVTEGRVIGMDVGRDLALVRSDEPFPGYTFRFSDEEAALGQEVAALGYPLEQDLTFTAGRVGGLDRALPGTDGRGGLLQTDAAINPGNSGGPLVELDGDVLGVVEAKRTWVLDADGQPAFSAEGMAFAVPAADASRAAARWQQSPEDVPSETCNDVAYADDTIEVAVASPHSDASTLAQSLLVHGQAVNSGAYDVAYAVFTERMRRRVGPVETWSAGLATSYWRHLLLVDVALVSEKVRQVDVELTTQQDPRVRTGRPDLLGLATAIHDGVGRLRLADRRRRGSPW